MRPRPSAPETIDKGTHGAAQMMRCLGLNDPATGGNLPRLGNESRVFPT